MAKVKPKGSKSSRSDRGAYDEVYVLAGFCVAMLVGAVYMGVNERGSQETRDACLSGSRPQIETAISQLSDPGSRDYYSKMLEGVAHDSVDWGANPEDYCTELDGLLVDVKESVQIEESAK